MDQATQQIGANANKVMLKVKHSLIHNLWRHLIHQAPVELLQASNITQNVSLDRLDSEDQRQQELDTVLFIVRQTEVLLQNDSLHGRDTSQRRLITDVLRQLWKYFLFNRMVREQECTPTSHYHEQEWMEDTLSPRSILEDCDAVIHILQQNTRLLEISEHVCSLEDLHQPLNRILSYLKNRSIKPGQSIGSDSDEENKLLKELTESIPVQMD